MALGALLKAGGKVASPSIKRALSKAMAFGQQPIKAPTSLTKTVGAIRKADARFTDRVISKIAKTPKIVNDRGASVRAKVAAVDAARAASRRTAERIVGTAYGTAIGSAIGGGLIAREVLRNKSKKSQGKKPSTPSKPSKPNNTTYVSKPSKPSTPSTPSTPPKSATPAKPAKVKMTSVPTVRNRRTPTTGLKTSVPVGSTIIRNKDGSIKKIKPPSGKKPKNKFEKMTPFQLNRLSWGS